MEIKKMFKLVDCRKSQAITIDAWYWKFQSIINENVFIKVTTYINCEDTAWDEFKNSLIGIDSNIIEG